MHIPVRTTTSGFSIPSLGVGTWMAGTKKTTYQHLDKEDFIHSLFSAIENGITFIDTAERYGDGLAETLIGKALKGKERKNLFISTKLSSKHRTSDAIILTAKQSLNRLKSQHIDLYSIHHYDPRVPMKVTMKALDYLVEKQYIKHIGVCNFSVDQIREAQSCTKHKIMANQMHYSVLSHTQAERDMVKYSQENDMIVIASNPFPQQHLTSQAKTIIDALALKYKQTSAQIAQAWLIQQKNIVLLHDFIGHDSVNADTIFSFTFTKDERASLQFATEIVTHTRKEEHA